MEQWALVRDPPEVERCVKMDTGIEYDLNNTTSLRNGDVGIGTWSLADTVVGIAAVVALYLLLGVKLLSAYMKNREPYKLKNILLFYNTFQVTFSAYVVVIYGRYLIINGLFGSKCSGDETMPTIIREIYPYFVAKHLDLLDTVFFVLRKKDKQITFLHVYHHSSMIAWTWLHLMHYPTDHFVGVGLLNSFVHVLMYAYYGISSLGPDYAKFVWWKKHLTKVQLVQFILVVSHLHYQQKLSACPIPPFFHYFCMGSIISFFFLFMNFYLNSYKPRKSKVELCEEKNGKITANSQNELLKSD